MKLPNFLSFEPFVIAKRKMGIAPNVLGDLRQIEIPISGPTKIEHEKLANEGLDVELDVVVENTDGTLGYKNKRVILYIRDVSSYGSFESDPKFHIANCRTLKDMRQNNRFGRYVIANKDTGRFSVRTRQSKKPFDKQLSVCQNCLDYLNFDEFELNWVSSQREIAVRNFSILRFFELYPKTLHYDLPAHTEVTAPENKYSDDFAKISARNRSERGWRCEEAGCGVVLSSPEYRKYLHVHHRDGLKNNNSPSNLKVLCLYCHSNQYQHHHMRSLPEYIEFMSIRSLLLNGR